MNQSKNWKGLKRIALVLVCLFSLAALQIILNNELFMKIELDHFDNKLEIRNSSQDPDREIIIFAIDEAALKALELQFGRWPWERSVWNQVIEYLGGKGVKNIYFDMIFSEYSKPPVNGVLEVGDNALLNGTMSYQDIVVHAGQVINEPETEDNYHTLNQPFSELIEPELFTLPNSSGVSHYNKLILPFDELLAVSNFVGSVDVSPDVDGVYRKLIPLRSYSDYYFKTLGLATVMTAENQFSMTDKELTFGNIKMPLDNGEVIVNLNRNFKSYSISSLFADIQKEKSGSDAKLFLSNDELENKIVFIAPFAAGLGDQKQTSLGRVPGVYLHASLLNSIKNQEFIQKTHPAWAVLLTLIFSLFLGAVIVYSNDESIKIMTTFVTIILFLLGDVILFNNYLLWLPSISIILAVFVGVFLSFIYRTGYENRDKRFLKAAFKNYISPELIEEIHESGEMPKLGGDVALRTAFFTDIADFSSFSEQLSPTDLVMVLNEYLTEMTKVLLEQKGTLDKYMGDAIVAFFGAPSPQADHAVRAAKVAIKMQKSHRLLRKKWKKDSKLWPDLVLNMKMRIGINSGDILTGNMGASGRMNYTMMGDAVNLAARLESSAKAYGVLIHISDSTRQFLGEDFLVRKLDRIVVKGKSKAVVTYELLAYQNEDQDLEKLVELFEEGLELYLQKEFNAAKALFTQSLDLEKLRVIDLELNFSPSQLYIERCNELLRNAPGPDWDGTTFLDQK